MKIKNKFILKLSMLTLLMCLLCVPVFAHETAEDTEQVYSLLSKLEIMVGDPDGSFRPDDYVTRGEFTKAAVAASDYKDTVALSLSVSPFSDVPYSHWAAPYVRVGVTNKLVTGYPDATFHPDDYVTFEEGVTIMLRVLGYSDSDFGAAWPNGQIGMAQRLDMTDALVSAETGEAMTRRDVATLIYNSLRCKKKDSQEILASIFDVSFAEDVTVISTSTQDGSVAGDEIFTDSGTYKIDDDFDKSIAGMKGDIALKDSKKALVFFPSEQSDTGEEKYVVYSVLSDTVIAWKDGEFEALDISPSAKAYNGTSTTTYSALMSSLEMGDILSVRRTNGEIDYIRYDEGEIKGPYTATDSSSLALAGASDSSTVIRAGKTSSASEIEALDVFYYLPELDTVFVYNTKVTGVYESASPNKDNPTEITVSGTTYKIESSQAFSALSSSGSLEYGDTVTLLMGRNNDIADVANTASTVTETSSEIAGYLIETGTKSYTSSDLKSYSGYYIKLVNAEGTTLEYQCDKDYSDYKNSVMVLTISDGKAKATKASNSSVRGSFAWETRRLGSDVLDSDVDILDVGTTDSNYTSFYTKTYASRLDGVNINVKDVLYAHKNSSGAIDKLILNNVTGDSFTYGLVTKAQSSSSGASASGSYEYIVDGTSYSFSSGNTAYTVSSGEGIKLSSTSNPDIFSSLTRLSGSSVAVDSTLTLTASGKSYLLATDVQVYEKETIYETLYRLKPLSELVGSDEYSITAYYDKAQTSGGRIRVIVAVKK